MLKKISSVFINADEIIASIALIFIVAITVLAVIMRYIVGQPLTWTGEATLGLMVWFTLLGSSTAFKYGDHVSIDLLIDRLPDTLQRIAIVVWHVFLIVILSIVFIGLGTILTLDSIDRVTTVLRISYFWVYLPVVLCGIYAVLHLLVGLKRSLVRK